MKELCRALDSGEKAMLCAISHGQVTLDGYVLKVTDDRRWSREQLAGRLAQINDRAVRVFGSARVRNETTQVAPQSRRGGD